jgi:DNA invertase Pin-like site-specific DNA recombinase
MTSLELTDEEHAALVRLVKQVIETIETLRVRGIGFRSLTEALDTTTAQGRLVFTCLARLRNSSAV